MTSATTSATPIMVLPGDHIDELYQRQQQQQQQQPQQPQQPQPQSTLRIGQGLRQDGAHAVATRAGQLCTRSGQRVWVETRQRRYLPAPDDAVLGTVLDRRGDAWQVDIGAPQLAVLPVDAFEGATKKNRPDLRHGTLVYARVAVAHRDMDTELACTTAAGKAAGFGEVRGGQLVRTSLDWCTSLLSPDNRLLAALGAAMPYEIAVGRNGRVWVNSTSLPNIIVVANAVAAAESLDATQVDALVRQIQQQQMQQKKQRGGGGGGGGGKR